LRRRLIARWQGILLALIGIVATVWLAATDRLGLYIHPRYFWFTVITAAIGALLVVAAFAVAPLPEPRDEEHEHDEHAHDEHVHAEAPTSTRAGGIRAVLTVTIVVGAAIALLVLPPATLTSATATQRSINSSGATVDQDAPALVGGDTSQFTVKDWALLLRQSPDAATFADKTVDVTGFVTASPDDPENVFYVARFVVTCCAVDAQPVGVPVYLPDWPERFSPDEWVTASGPILPNPGSSSAESLLLTPDEISVTDQPDQPYVY
jgi:putative membrane protein